MGFEAQELGSLLSEASDRLKEDRRNNFRIICLTSDLGQEDLVQAFSHRFTVSDQGEFVELSTSYTKYGEQIEVNLYLYSHPEYDNPLLFTLNSSGDLSRTVEPLIKSTEGIYYLWMPPSIVESIKETLLDIEGSKLTYFTYEKFGGEQRFEEEIRPEYERKGEHRSDDAAQILEEMKLKYGITPTRLEYEIPPNEFRFSNLGAFVMTKGQPSFLYNEIVDLGLEKVQGINNAIQSSELKIVEEEETERVTKQTLEIELENPLDYEDANDFLDKLNEGEFFPYNVSKSRGSLLLNGRIIDQDNGGMFTISSDGRTFSVLPKYDSDFDSLMRFYRFMVEKIDSDASVRVETNG